MATVVAVPDPVYYLYSNIVVERMVNYCGSYQALYLQLEARLSRNSWEGIMYYFATLENAICFGPKICSNFV